jgi:hypothetical protein
MLSILEATPEDLRLIADFLESDHGAIDDLADAGIIPVVEAGGGEPDKLIGFEKAREVSSALSATQTTA